MIETLYDYQRRTSFMWDSLQHSGGFRTSDGLCKKVEYNGEFKPFYGNTVIFSLDNATIEWLANIQEELYRVSGEYLAKKIEPTTFHITLHDLRSNSERMPSEIEEDRTKANELIESAKDQYPNAIYIESKCIFSMVGTSIVMGFEPQSESDCNMLMTMYEKFQNIVPLSYPLTLHATLAYYKPGVYGDDVLYKLRETLYRLGREPRVCRLSLDKLFYATFENMNCYYI